MGARRSSGEIVSGSTKIQIHISDFRGIIRASLNELNVDPAAL